MTMKEFNQSLASAESGDALIKTLSSLGSARIPLQTELSALAWSPWL